ncbi:MAG: uracil-DNA glycosylase [Clostridia bacterium]|nr:uracil-DNA glycosylase [Clostridia bacterium]
MQQFQQKMTAHFSTLWPAQEKRLVFGEGASDHPDIMLIGEAPGEQETLLGRPFVGKAGKNLDGFLQVVGLRREDIYISNVVKIRPTKVSARGSVSNRPPNREELALFTPYLYEEIMLVSPRVIVTLGNVALKALAGSKAVIGAMHGRAAEVTVTHGKKSAKTAIFPLYHPASIIYNRSLQEVYAEDLQKLKEWLE